MDETARWRRGSRGQGVGKRIVEFEAAWSKPEEGWEEKPINFTMANSETVATPFL